MASPSSHAGWLRTTAQFTTINRIRDPRRAENSATMQRFQIRFGFTLVIREVRNPSASANNTPSAAMTPYDGTTRDPMWKKTGYTCEKNIFSGEEGRNPAHWAVSNALVNPS